MAVDIPDDEIVKYTLEGLLDDQMTQNVFYLRTINPSTLEAVEDFLNNNLLAKFAISLSNEWTIVKASVQGISPLHTDPYEEAKAYPGQTAGAALPVANAIVVAMKTGVGGRHNRGRKYMPAVLASSVDNSRLTLSYQQSLQVDWNNMNDIFKPGGTGELVWGIRSRTVVNNAPVYAFTPVNSCIVRPILGTMRSRLPGHGR